MTWRGWVMTAELLAGSGDWSKSCAGWMASPLLFLLLSECSYSLTSSLVKELIPFVTA
jgi:hypothetical protein